MSEFERILEKHYEPIEIAGSYGHVRKGFKESLAQFDSLELNPWPGDAKSDLFNGSTISRVSVLGGLCIPKINGVFVYGRGANSKEEENPAASKRFENSVISYERGVRTPLPIAEFSQPIYHVTEYAGRDTLLGTMIEIIHRQDDSLEVVLSTAERAIWKSEQELSAAYKLLLPELPYVQLLVALNQVPESKVKDCMKGIEFKLAASAYYITTDFPATGNQKFDEEIETLRRRLGNDGMALLRERLNVYLSSREIVGKLIVQLGKLTHPYERIFDVAVDIGKFLRIANDRGVLLYDVAPRDIVLDPDCKPWFVDMENVEFFKRPLSEVEQRKQLEQFRSDLLVIKPESKVDLVTFMSDVKKGYQKTP